MLMCSFKIDSKFIKIKILYNKFYLEGAYVLIGTTVVLNPKNV